MDVNESIVSTQLNENGYFILNNIYYGQFHSDIDILAVNLNKRIILDCEIKIRTGSTKISNNDNKQNGFLHICNQLNSEIRKNKVISLIGTDKGFKQKKLLITTRSFFGSSLENRKGHMELRCNLQKELFIVQREKQVDKRFPQMR